MNINKKLRINGLNLKSMRNVCQALIRKGYRGVNFVDLVNRVEADYNQIAYDPFLDGVSIDGAEIIELAGGNTLTFRIIDGEPILVSIEKTVSTESGVRYTELQKSHKWHVLKSLEGRLPKVQLAA